MPKGFCEPLLFIATVGLFAGHCINTYRVTFTSNGEENGAARYTVTSWIGWFALVLAPFPQWEMVNAWKTSPEESVEEFVRGNQ
jgi:hypothetical protein